MLNSLANFDHQLFQFIYHLPRPFLFVVIMEFFSLAGYIGIIWILLGMYYKKLVPILIALLLTLVIVDVGVKSIVAHPRPYPSTLDQFLPWESFSFPSGHAAAAFASLYILTKSKIQNSNDKSNSKIKIQNFILPLAVIISFSRIYLRKHYPFDIVGGAVIGYGIGWIVGKIQMKRFK